MIELSNSEVELRTLRMRSFDCLWAGRGEEEEEMVEEEELKEEEEEEGSWLSCDWGLENEMCFAESVGIGRKEEVGIEDDVKEFEVNGEGSIGADVGKTEEERDDCAWSILSLLWGKFDD